MAAVRQELILDMRGALAQIQTLEKELQDLRKPVDIPIDVRGDAVADVRTIDQRLQEIESSANEVNRELSEMALAAGATVADFSRLARELDVSEDEARKLTQEILETRNASVRTADAAKDVARQMGLSEEEASRFSAEVDKSRQKVDQLGSTSGSISKLEAGFKKLVVAAAAFVGIQQLGSFVSGAIKNFSALEESTSKANVVFGDFANTIFDFTANAPEQLGSTSAAAIEAASSVGNLFLSIGLGQQAAADMSVEIVQLGTDLASFNNITVDEALEKLRSGLVGETEPLRTLGVLLSEAAVNAKGFELGLGGVSGKLSEAEKVQARFAIIMEQTATAQGDFARTADGIANSQRSVTAAFEEFKAKIGEALAPLFGALLDQAPALIAGLEDMVPALSGIVTELTRISAIGGPVLSFLLEFDGLVAQGLAVIAETIGEVFSFDEGTVDVSGIVNFSRIMRETTENLQAGVKPALAFSAGLQATAASSDLTAERLKELARTTRASTIEQAAALRALLDNPGEATTAELIVLRNALVDVEEELRGASEANRDYQFIAETLAGTSESASTALLSQATVLTLLRTEADLLGISLSELLAGGGEKFPELAGLIGQLEPATAGLALTSERLNTFATTFEESNVRISDAIDAFGLLPEKVKITKDEFTANLTISAAEEAEFQANLVKLFLIAPELATLFQQEGPSTRELVKGYLNDATEAQELNDVLTGNATELTGVFTDAVGTAIETSTLDDEGIAALELFLEGFGNTTVAAAGVAALQEVIQTEIDKMKFVIPSGAFSFEEGGIPFGGGVVGNGTVGGGTGGVVVNINNPVAQDLPTNAAQAGQSIGAASATFNRIVN